MSFGGTYKQNELLTFLRERQAAGGSMPSYEEMMVAIRLKSKSGVVRLLNTLEERGAIRRFPNRARAVEVLGVDPNTLLDANAALSLSTYCHITGLARRTVVTDALREYFRAHPVPKAAGGER